MPTPIADIRPTDRPRERLWRLGARVLSDAELVALILGCGTVGASSLELAQELLAARGGAAGLGAVRAEELAAARGVGPARGARLLAAVELGRRLGWAAGVDASDPIRSPADLARLAVVELAGLRHERLLAIVLDSARRPIRVVTIAEGWSDRAPAPIREIIAAVARNDGACFALAHNHPTGDPAPSLADRAVTESVERGASVAGLPLLDHVVVAGPRWRAIRASQGSDGD